MKNWSDNFWYCCKPQFYGDNFINFQPKGVNDWVLSNLCHWEFDKKCSKKSKSNFKEKLYVRVPWSYRQPYNHPVEIYRI